MGDAEARGKPEEVLVGLAVSEPAPVGEGVAEALAAPRRVLLGVSEPVGVAEALAAARRVLLGVSEPVAVGEGVAESLACSRRAPAAAASGSTRHTGLRLPKGSKSMMHGVRHWQPLVDTGHVGQLAGAAVGVERGVSDLEEEEEGSAVGVGALEREPLAE